MPKSDSSHEWSSSIQNYVEKDSEATVLSCCIWVPVKKAYLPLTCSAGLSSEDEKVELVHIVFMGFLSLLQLNYEIDGVFVLENKDDVIASDSDLNIVSFTCFFNDLSFHNVSGLAQLSLLSFLSTRQQSVCKGDFVRLLITNDLINLRSGEGSVNKECTHTPKYKWHYGGLYSNIDKVQDCYKA